MTSFIIVSKDPKKRLAYSNEFCRKQNIHAVDITIIEKDTIAKTQSIGIEDVKNIQKKIYFKPIKSKTKAIIINDAQLLTIEAQNSLLKILEEPPEHTIIILATETKETLLPTILSRCQIIELEQEQKELSEKEIHELTEFLHNLLQMPIGDRLKKAELLAKEKEKAIKWIEKMIPVLRNLLVRTYSITSSPLTGEERGEGEYYFRLIQSLQKLHTLLKTTNANPRFAIENTLLQYH
jgi:hypothetical protein